MPGVVPRPQPSVEWRNKGKNEWSSEKRLRFVLLRAIRKAEKVSCDRKEQHANHVELNKHQATRRWSGSRAESGGERAVGPPELTGAGGGG